MKDYGLVSVIMPSYNTEKYIAVSIESVLHQSYSNWELIIVDDCSTDDTDSVVQPLLTDARIRYLKNNANSGAAISRNRALREANGKWIAFLDSDDLWLPEKLERQLSFMAENDYHFSYTDYEEIDENGNALGIKVTGPRKITKKGMRRYCWPGCLTVMYDAENVGLIQIADIKKNNDYAMWLKVSRNMDCYLYKQILANYRRGRKGSISTHGYLLMIKWHYRLFHEANGDNCVLSLFFTLRNVLYGAIKKILYVKRNI